MEVKDVERATGREQTRTKSEVKGAVDKVGFCRLKWRTEEREKSRLGRIS